MSAALRIRSASQLRDLVEAWSDTPEGIDVDVELYAADEEALRGILWDACKTYRGPERWVTHQGAYVLNDATRSRCSTTVTVVGTFA